MTEQAAGRLAPSVPRSRGRPGARGTRHEGRRPHGPVWQEPGPSEGFEHRLTGASGFAGPCSVVAAVLFESRPDVTPPVAPATAGSCGAGAGRGAAAAPSHAPSARGTDARGDAARRRHPPRRRRPSSHGKRRWPADTNPARQPSQRVDRRGATPSPLTSRGPARVRRPQSVPDGTRPPGQCGRPAILRRCEVYWQTGVSPDAADATGITPLMLDGHPQDHGAVAELLLARGADVNGSDNGGVTALMLAASNGRTALLQRLVNRGATVDARAQTRAGRRSPMSAWNGRAPAVRRLLGAGADPTPYRRDADGLRASGTRGGEPRTPRRTRHPDRLPTPPAAGETPAAR